MTDQKVETVATDLNAVQRLSRDLTKAAATMTDEEARFLVDAYYIMQDDRKRSNSQVSALAENEEPHAVLVWFAQQNATLEKQIARALDSYTAAHPMGSWMRTIVGVGPVISAGLLAHIDIEKAPTVGHIWSFAGLDPTRKWGKGEKRPWNARLKVVCWKFSQSIMKFSNRDDCLYGQLYKKRKAYEITRNDNGGNKETAAKILVERKFGKDTDAYKHLSGGKLPPAQIDARARRWATKLFLAHLHEVWYFSRFGKLPPFPYPLSILGHDKSHYIPPPSIDLVPGLRAAKEAQSAGSM